MAEKKESTSHMSGKRKRAVARASVKKGKGIVRINKTPIELYSTEILRLRIKEPIIIAGEKAKNLDITVNVSGGGVSAQAEASRLAIAKALVTHLKSPELKQMYLEYDRNLLVADTRYRESCKPMTHSNARRKRQLSFR